MMDAKGVDAGLLQSRYRLTRQRAAILRALEDGAHLTAETILERVRGELPAISLGTIYRTLDILRELGLVQVFSYAGNAARYEASLDKHHHLVCSVCRGITNIPVHDLGALARSIADLHRYADVEASLTITGRCPRCATESDRARPGSS
jgi:Fur family transcriptional regulator, peroxide stress response regulator